MVHKPGKKGGYVEKTAENAVYFYVGEHLVSVQGKSTATLALLKQEGRKGDSSSQLVLSVPTRPEGLWVLF